MHVPASVQARVNARIAEVMQIATRHYGREFPAVVVDYKKRGTTAGTAHPGTRAISLNSVILMENQDDFIARTVGHEVAHIIDKDVNGHRHNVTRTGRFKRDSHGPNWKAIMVLFGQDPSRCHDFDVTNARVQKTNNRTKHIWTCGCGQADMDLGDKRHQRQLAAHARGSGCFYMRNHKWTKCGHYTYTHTLTNGVRTPVTSTPAPAPAPTRVPAGWERITTVPAPRVARAAPGGTSKLALSRALYIENFGVSRQAMITLFVQEAGCTPAGAATYYAKHKKEV